MKQRFFKCQKCGQITNVIKDTNLTMMCCMVDMLELIPNTEEADGEKHIPVTKKEGCKYQITVGEKEHPMETQHMIEWILLQTKNGCQRINLKPGDKPCAEFYISCDDKAEAVYAYCNMHGLWMAEL